MKRKTIFKALGLIFILSIIIIFYQLVTFKLFDVNYTIIEKISIPDKKYQIHIYYVPGDATIESSIQVRKIENNVQEVLGRYERFNYLNSYSITKDSLILFVSDSSSVVKNSVKKALILP